MPACFLLKLMSFVLFLFFFQAEDGIRDWSVTGVQTCALPILHSSAWLESSNQDQSDEEEDSNQAEECRKNRKEGAVEEILPQGPQGPLCSHSAAPGLTLHRSVHDSRPLQPRDDGPSTDD